MNFDLLNELGKNIDKSSIDLSNVYEVYAGGFGSNDAAITSYICSTSIKQLSEDLITFEKLLKAKKWPVSKILQREVSRVRVEEISKLFIQGADRVKYFPPIVVALLPRDKDNMAEVYTRTQDNEYLKIAKEKLFSDSKFGSDLGFKDQILNKSEMLSAAEGILVLKPFEINYQLFAWDKSKFFAIVIDGQHRFESLKKAAEDPTTGYNMWKQDVIFIDGSSLSLNSNIQEYLPVNFFRKIFIDINKHPVTVSKAKQIIMDDNDVASLFVQSILDDDQQELYKYLRPELIDWHSSASKYELPYLTSVLNLHSIFQGKLLNGKVINTISDLTDAQKVKEWVDRLNDYFFVDDTIEKYSLSVKKLNDSLDEYKEIWKDDEFELFNFDRQTLIIAQDNFAKIYRESFVKFFNSLRPYTLLIDFLSEKNIFDRSSDLSDIVLKSPKNRERSEEILYNRLKRDCEERLGDKYSILLSVVGQKSLIEIYYTYLTTKRGAQLTNERHLQLTEEFIDEVNSVLEIIERSNSNLFGKSDSNESYAEFVKNNYSKIVKDYPALSSTFWSEMLYFGSTIKYNSIGVRAISKILNYCIVCHQQSSDEEIVKLSVLNNNEFKYRIKSLLISTSGYNKSEEEAEKIATIFLEIKSNYLKSLFLKGNQ